MGSGLQVGTARHRAEAGLTLYYLATGGEAWPGDGSEQCLVALLARTFSIACAVLL